MSSIKRPYQEVVMFHLAILSEWSSGKVSGLKEAVATQQKIVEDTKKTMITPVQAFHMTWDNAKTIDLKQFEDLCAPTDLALLEKIKDSWNRLRMLVNLQTRIDTVQAEMLSSGYKMSTLG